MKIEYPTEEEWVERIANKALNEFEINGRTLNQWMEILADVYAVVDSYGIDIHRDRGDLTDFEMDILEALKLSDVEDKEQKDGDNRA